LRQQFFAGLTDMAVTFETLPSGSIRISRDFRTLAAAAAGASAIERVTDGGYEPIKPIPEPDPQRVDAYLELHDEDEPTSRLKAGEAERES